MWKRFKDKDVFFLKQHLSALRTPVPKHLGSSASLRRQERRRFITAARPVSLIIDRKNHQKPSKTIKNPSKTIKNHQKPSKTIKKPSKNHQKPLPNCWFPFDFPPNTVGFLSNRLQRPRPWQMTPARRPARKKPPRRARAASRWAACNARGVV